MNLHSTIDAFAGLEEILSRPSPELNEVIYQSYLHNNWFTEENTRLALHAIAEKFLNREKINEWLSRYPAPGKTKEKKVGIVMAGNIPLVGFHDFLCVILSGNIAQIKLSSKDRFLFPFLAEKLAETEPSLNNKIQFAETLKNFDAVIATGSNNSARYFEYYFSKYPHIIRKHRSSVAVLSGEETEDELKLLGKDIFQYFGMGCRNVSKIYVPLKYDFSRFFKAMDAFKNVGEHHKYKNNYDYNRTLLLMNRTPHLANEFLMLVEKEEISSPIASLHYEFYQDEKELLRKLMSKSNEIQCITSNYLLKEMKVISFGQTQLPELWDYADEVDTMGFLGRL